MSILTGYIEDTLKDLPEETEAIDDLGDLYNTVSSEAFSVGDVGSYLKRKSGRIAASFNDCLRHLTTFDFKQPEVINARAQYRVLSTLDFSAFADKTIYVPVGFKGDLLEYTDYLSKEVMPFLSKLQVSILAQAKKCFAHYINSTADASDTELMYKLDFTDEELERLKGLDKGFLIPGNRRSTSELSEVIGNFNDYNTVCLNANQINQTMWNTINPRNVEREVDNISKLSGKLFGVLDQSDSKLSPEFVQNLVGMLRDVAVCVEYYAAVSVRMRDLTTALKLNEKYFIKQ